MKHYFPTGRRNYGRPLKRILDTWDWNGSTSGTTLWQIYDDDDDECQEITYCVSILPRTQFSHRLIIHYATHALRKSSLNKHFKTKLQTRHRTHSTHGIPPPREHMGLMFSQWHY
jgi:hypothetical protein